MVDGVAVEGADVVGQRVTALVQLADLGVQPVELFLSPLHRHVLGIGDDLLGLRPGVDDQPVGLVPSTAQLALGLAGGRLQLLGGLGLGGFDRPAR